MTAADPRKAAMDAWWMGLERDNRRPTPKEVHAQWLKVLETRYVDETRAASDWLLSRMPELRTPSGFACGFALHALKGLRVECPGLVGDELLAAVVAYRDGRLVSIGAEDLVVALPSGRVAGSEAA